MSNNVSRLSRLSAAKLCVLDANHLIVAVSDPLSESLLDRSSQKEIPEPSSSLLVTAFECTNTIMGIVLGILLMLSYLSACIIIIARYHVSIENISLTHVILIGMGGSAMAGITVMLMMKLLRHTVLIPLMLLHAAVPNHRHDWRCRDDVESNEDHFFVVASPATNDASTSIVTDLASRLERRFVFGYIGGIYIAWMITGAMMPIHESLIGFGSKSL
jgi:hypothetical protein